MILTPAQKIIAKDRHRFRVVNCGRRFGKTTLAALEMIAFATAHENARVPYYAPTRDDARDIMWNMLNKMATGLIIDKNEGRLELTIKNRFGGESLMVLYGWEAVQERRKGVGVKNNFIVLDELAKYRNFLENWQQVLRPTLTDLKGHTLFISTPQGFNHFHDLYFLEKKDDDFKSFHFTSYDNPFLPVTEIDKAKRELTEDSFAQEYLADFRKHTGLIYKEFDRSLHIIEPFVLPAYWQFYRAMDFGATHPTVCLWFAVDNLDNVYVIDEYYVSNKTIEAHAGMINAKTHLRNIITTWGDPSAEQARLDYTSYGIIISPAVRLTQDKEHSWVKSGIEKVGSYLKTNYYTGKPRLFIFSNCINTIKEFELYKWMDKKESGIDTETPLKINDDAMDALRYFIVSYDAQRNDFEEETVHVETNQYTGY